MGWIGWALAVLGFGAGVVTTVAPILLNERIFRSAKSALAVGIMNANCILEALLAFLFFRERLQPSKLVGLAATLSGPWLMAH